MWGGVRGKKGSVRPFSGEEEEEGGPYGPFPTPQQKSSFFFLLMRYI